MPVPMPPSSAPGSARRYHVNVLVDRSALTGAPVVYADQPAYNDLVGRVEHVSQFGALITDFTLIKSGALPLDRHSVSQATLGSISVDQSRHSLPVGMRR